MGEYVFGDQEPSLTRGHTGLPTIPEAVERSLYYFFLRVFKKQQFTSLHNN